MKKLFLAAMAFVCLFAVSCDSVNYKRIEDAYAIEVKYRSVKDTMGGAAAAAKYQEEFLHIWCNMTDDERTEYANYKSYVDVLDQQEKAIKAAGLKELNK